MIKCVNSRELYRLLEGEKFCFYLYNLVLVVSIRILKLLTVLHRGHEIDWISSCTNCELDFLTNILVAKVMGKRASDQALCSISAEVIDCSPFR